MQCVRSWRENTEQVENKSNINDFGTTQTTLVYIKHIILCFFIFLVSQNSKKKSQEKKGWRCSQKHGADNSIWNLPQLSTFNILKIDMSFLKLGHLADTPNSERKVPTLKIPVLC